MAFWLTALKLIPWKDVIQTAPDVVKSARQLWQGIRKDNVPPIPSEALPDATANPIGNLQARVATLEHERAQAQAKALKATELVSQLAEQQKQLVDHISRLRSRSRWLAVVCGVMALAIIKVWFWG